MSFAPDPEAYRETIADAIETIGSKIRLANNRVRKAVKIEEEKEIARIFKVVGSDVTEKLPTVFQFDYTCKGLINRGDEISSIDGHYNVELIHTEIHDDVIVYVAACGYLI